MYTSRKIISVAALALLLPACTFNTTNSTTTSGIVVPPVDPIDHAALASKFRTAANTKLIYQSDKSTSANGTYFFPHTDTSHIKTETDPIKAGEALLAFVSNPNTEKQLGNAVDAAGNSATDGVSLTQTFHNKSLTVIGSSSYTLKVGDTKAIFKRKPAILKRTPDDNDPPVTENKEQPAFTYFVVDGNNFGTAPKGKFTYSGNIGVLTSENEYIVQGGDPHEQIVNYALVPFEDRPANWQALQWENEKRDAALTLEKFTLDADFDNESFEFKTTDRETSGVKYSIDGVGSIDTGTGSLSSSELTVTQNNGASGSAVVRPGKMDGKFFDENADTVAGFFFTDPDLGQGATEETNFTGAFVGKR